MFAISRAYNHRNFSRHFIRSRFLLLYWEYSGNSYLNVKGVTIPAAVSVFPDELYPALRRWAEQAYPDLIHYNKLEKGGHFAAWEQPELLTSELRAAFKSLR